MLARFFTKYAFILLILPAMFLCQKADYSLAAQKNTGQVKDKHLLVSQVQSDTDQTGYPDTRKFRITVPKAAGNPEISVYFPQLGVHDVDARIRAIATEMALGYLDEAEGYVEYDREHNKDVDTSSRYFLDTNYSLSRPNPDFASIIWDSYFYTGGAHAIQDMRCCNYDLKTGRELNFDNLFADREMALKLLSVISRKLLAEQMGEDLSEDMMLGGTEPKLDNFQNISLLPNGMEVYFPRYQVGPWSAGTQSVFIPVVEMREARPNPQIWPILRKGADSE